MARTTAVVDAPPSSSTPTVDLSHLQAQMQMMQQALGSLMPHHTPRLTTSASSSSTTMAVKGNSSWPLLKVLPMEGSENERGGFGKMNYGCEHYRRRCKIRAPCCNRIFDCRYCHIEAMSKLSDPSEWHELARNAIKQVVCSVCGREQPVARICTNCGVNMGEYFCDICKLYDDDIQKGHFHCTDCGICRVGGRENFFHCEKCGTCYALHLRNRHVCVENSMRHNCPICCEYLFDSRKGTTIMKCGHTIHCECYNKMVKHRVRCPICSGLLVDVPGP